MLLCLGILLSANAQFHTPVLPGVTGQDLIDGLVTNYKPSTVLSYAQARDSMFANVYSQNDSLSCVYSGHTIYLDPSLDPTTAAFMNGNDNGINTEHSWPQGLGAGNGDARSNIYHLFPTRIDVNGDRANSPFSEIPDDETDEWYYLGNSQSSIPPSATIDLFSERKGNLFEPREDHKGDVARAMFYFYTMYKAEADAEGPNFFELQRETLCNWHLLDPVNEIEWNRNVKIATYQSDRSNPFILDCTILARCYCADQGQECMEMTSVDDELASRPFSLAQNVPNPFTNDTTIEYELEKNFNVRLVVYNMLGQLVKVLIDEEQGTGDYQQTFSVRDLQKESAGVFIYCLELTDGEASYFETRKLVVGI